jgi:ribose/xylose/arabinose/galactoside ABC-type transport system permease subunit
MSGDHGFLAGHPLAAPAALAAILAAGAVVGFFNGACIAWLRMPAFMVTLTTMMFFSGFAIWLAKKAVNAESIYNLPPAFLVIGAKPWIGAALAICATIAAHLLLSRTLLGRWLYAVGHNPRASLVSGVPVGGVVVSAYVISGLFAALASILLTATLETGSPNHGKALLLDVIGAAVIGGTSLFGGKGKVLWTCYGVLFLSLLGNGLNQLNFSDSMITIIKGSVILLAALLDHWRTRFASAQ